MNRKCFLIIALCLFCGDNALAQKTTSQISKKPTQKKETTVTSQKYITVDSFICCRQYEVQQIFSSPHNADLNAIGKRTLDKIFSYLDEDKYLDVHFWLYGFFDDTAYTKWLNDLRADSLSQYFVNKGIFFQRIHFKKFVDPSMNRKYELYFRISPNNFDSVQQDKLLQCVSELKAEQKPLKVVPPKANLYLVQIDLEKKNIDDIQEILSEKAPDITIFSEMEENGTVSHYAGSFLIKDGAMKFVARLKRIGINSSIKEEIRKK